MYTHPPKMRNERRGLAELVLSSKHGSERQIGGSGMKRMSMCICRTAYSHF
jgi:hypothetical protein